MSPGPDGPEAWDLSVLVPVRDECGAIPSLAQEIEAACVAAGLKWETIWIDDASSDGSSALLQALPAPHRLLRFAQRQGQSAALLAGASAARAPWLGILDGDGQNDPADLPQQLDLARSQGLDLVNGIRRRRQDRALRRISSRLAALGRGLLLGPCVRDSGCATRVLRRDLLLDLPFFDGLHRFLPDLVRMQGGHQVEVPVKHRPRREGQSKYGIHNRLWVGLIDCFGVCWLRRRQRLWRSAIELSLTNYRCEGADAGGGEGGAAESDSVERP